MPSLPVEKSYCLPLSITPPLCDNQLNYPLPIFYNLGFAVDLDQTNQTLELQLPDHYGVFTTSLWKALPARTSGVWRVRVPVDWPLPRRGDTTATRPTGLVYFKVKTMHFQCSFEFCVPLSLVSEEKINKTL